MTNEKKENQLEINSSIEDQKVLLSLLRMRKDFILNSSLINKIKKNIANFETLKNKDKDKK